MAGVQHYVPDTVAATRVADIRVAAHALEDATRLEMAVSPLEMEAGTSSEAVAFTATLDTSLVGGQQAEGKALLKVGEVDVEESADEADLADLNPEFVAAQDVATEFPSNHDEESATALSADV